jgi:hypothetical protein
MFSFSAFEHRATIEDLDKQNEGRRQEVERLAGLEAAVGERVSGLRAHARR